MNIQINNENKLELLFSQDFYDRNMDNLIGMKKVLLERLKIFNDYYEKYDLTNVRIINDVDIYAEAKIIYDKIFNKDLFVDKVLMNPDNYLKNAIQLLEIDKFKFKKRS